MNLEHEENITKRGRKRHTNAESASFHEDIPNTPSRCAMKYGVPRTPVNVFKNETEITPRRSARKSVKPAQDYDDIVNGRTLRSNKKEEPSKKTESEEAEPKWTIANVGRVSQKRASRKSWKKSLKYKPNGEKPKKTHQDLIELQECPLGVKQMDDDVFTASVKESNVVNTTFSQSQPEKNAKSFNTDFVEIGSAPILDEDEVDKNVICVKDSEHVIAESREFVATGCPGNMLELCENKNIKVESNEICETNVTETSKEETLSILDPNFPENVIEKSEKDTDDVIYSKQVSSNEDQEMPSLIFCEDDDDEILDSNKIAQTETKLDNTFDASECFIISPDQPTIYSGKNVDSPLVEAGKRVKEIQNKYFTPNKIKSQAIPEIVVDFVQKNEPAATERCKLPISTVKTAPMSTPGSITKRNVGGVGTPTLTKTKPGYRFPTPFKTKIDLNFSKTGKENTLLLPFANASTITTMEPKEIVMRSIRKRSLSTTDGEQRKRKGHNVTFYSPANQTATTEDVDELLAVNALKTNTKQETKIKLPRKRSTSLDENALRLPSKLPRRVIPTVKLTKSPAKLSARKKPPNFAAIHEKQFKKMENLVDYVARKAERAHNLTAPAFKAQTGFLHKSPRKVKPDAVQTLPLAASSNSKENSDKVIKRREQHLVMLNGRFERKPDLKAKNSELIKGVRSNRRFDLLMQHRKTSGN